jgi:threonine synthase
MVSEIRCPKCGVGSPSKTEFRCHRCQCALEVSVAVGHLTKADFASMRSARGRSIWRWFEFFPVAERSSVVSLGEGDTPLVRAGQLGALLDIANLYIKNDTLLPTGSLKDRSNTVAISVAKELGFTTAAVMSTGNAAASVAAYAAAAGMRSVVMVPAGTALSKVLQARAYGATVVVVRGSFDDEVTGLYRAAIDEFGWYDCLSSNPYRNGKKSYAYETVDQLDGAVPDWIIHPTAGGAGIHFMWQGFGELLSLGCIERRPRLIAAQSAAAAPIVRAFENDSSEIVPLIADGTVAESIRVGNPAALGWRALGAVRESMGCAVACSDLEILEAQALLARVAGVFAEPAAAAVSLAAAKKLRARGTIGRQDLVVCNVTGHGLKQPEAMHVAEEDLEPILPSLEGLRERLRTAEQ